MHSFCILFTLNCASPWFTAKQFANGIAGPGIRNSQICYVDYVTVWYVDNVSCEDQDPFECLWQVDVIHCDDFVPHPDDWFVACSWRDEFQQKHSCTELFDYDSDADIDLFDFAEFQNDWQVDPVWSDDP
jgi:hypothetical protein